VYASCEKGKHPYELCVCIVYLYIVLQMEVYIQTAVGQQVRNYYNDTDAASLMDFLQSTVHCIHISWSSFYVDS